MNKISKSHGKQLYPSRTLSGYVNHRVTPTLALYAICTIVSSCLCETKAVRGASWRRTVLGIIGNSALRARVEKWSISLNGGLGGESKRRHPRVSLLLARGR